MKRIELLAPGGDIASIKAAIHAGADAVYCGLDKFNARNRAANISFSDLNGIFHLAHKNNCEVFLTLNIIITDSEIPAIITLLNKLINTSIDGIIIQDLGLCYLLNTYFNRLKIHASTQLTTHNKGQILFLSRLNSTRVNLSRELNINEVKELTETAHSVNMLTEIFVHGSNCISFSGICYMSSVHGGNSGNRGRCSQPCREQYLTSPAGKDFPLNLKDNSAFSDLHQIADAGVDSIKIEGRIKKFHYVYTVVKAWRKQLNRFYQQEDLSTEKSALYSVFNRDFSNAFLSGNINRDMFIDNPRDHSAIWLSQIDGYSTDAKLEQAKADIYDDRTELIRRVETEINRLSIAKEPLTIKFSGICGNPLKIELTTPDLSFEVFSEVYLTDTGKETLTVEMLSHRFKALNETEFFIEKIDVQALPDGLYLPFKELTSLKKKLLFQLNGSIDFIDSIEVPQIKRQQSVSNKTTLSILISEEKDLHYSNGTDATVFFQLPNSLQYKYSGLIDIFRSHSELIPWFPSVLTGNDYNAAVEFLKDLKPEKIVTDNSGIAFEAYKTGIRWIAGPTMNCINSFSLLCLKENFNCSGAFISNEISKAQLKGINAPDDFDLFYSIYHPIVLMTSRQCFFHQVTGCEKDRIDDNCIPHCIKTSSITNLKGKTFMIEKSEGNLHRIFNETNYLNTDIITDFFGIFSGFCIDLRNINTKTCIPENKKEIIRLFENILNRDAGSEETLRSCIYPTISTQYRKGI